MALCDFLITKDLVGYDCNNSPVKGVEARGMLVNRSDIAPNYWTDGEFAVDFGLKAGAKGYEVIQSGKTPYNGTQQELVEGANANTITNTLQLVVLKQDKDWAQQLFALMNGEFVAVLQNKQKNVPIGNCQIYGWEAGLHCTGAVRELYNDDTLAGWQITFTEEGAAKGNFFTSSAIFDLLDETSVGDYVPSYEHLGFEEDPNGVIDNPDPTEPRT